MMIDCPVCMRKTFLIKCGCLSCGITSKSFSCEKCFTFKTEGFCKYGIFVCTACSSKDKPLVHKESNSEDAAAKYSDTFCPNCKIGCDILLLRKTTGKNLAGTEVGYDYCTRCNYHVDYIKDV